MTSLCVITISFVGALLATNAAQELKLELEDKCYYNEIPNFSLEVKTNIDSAKILHDFVGDEWLDDRKKCYATCCSDEFQIAGNGRCTAVSFYTNKTSGKRTCRLVQCEPEDACLWSHGKPGFIGVFIRSEKTTPAPTTTTTTTTVSTVAAGNDELSQDNRTTPAVLLQGNDAGSVGDTSPENTEGTGQAGGAELPEGTSPSTPTQEPQWTWQSHDGGHAAGDDSVLIEPMAPSRGEERGAVPTRGLVAGIVLAILLVLLLVSFLIKQLRSVRKQPSRYKPIDEEEYEKLTVGEET